MADEPLPPPEPVVVHPGDLVQITDQTVDAYPAIFIVDEVKGWGVQAHCVIPTQDKGVAVAKTRIQRGTFVVVGAAHLMPEPTAKARAVSLETARVAASEREGG